MQPPPTDALDAALRIARAFETHGVPYAIGGALAYGLYGIPRATNDVDVNVFLTPERLDGVLAALVDGRLPRGWDVFLTSRVEE
jgi:hypothetical protein